MSQDVRPFEQHSLETEHDNALQRARIERERYRQALFETKRDRLERAERRNLQPWWRSWNIAAMTAIIAAIAPATAALQAYIEKGKELALDAKRVEQDISAAKIKFREDVRTAYLDRVRDPQERRRTLRFLAATTDDLALRQWANSEIDVVAKESTDQQKEDADLQKKAEEAWHDAIQSAPTKAASAALKADYARAVSGRADDRDRAVHLLAAAGGKATQSMPLSVEIQAAVATRADCIKKRQDPQACVGESALLKNPTDADISLIQSLETRAAAGDRDAFKELVQERALFLAGGGH